MPSRTSRSETSQAYARFPASELSRYREGRLPVLGRRGTPGREGLALFRMRNRLEATCRQDLSHTGVQSDLWPVII